MISTADAAPADEVSPEIIPTRQRDLGLSKEQVRRRLNFEAAAASIEKDVHAWHVDVATKIASITLLPT